MNALIIDDEYHARENLKMLLEEYCPYIKVLGEARDLKSGLLAITEHKPDVVFLDIRMPSGSEGFEMLEQCAESDFLVVFVTAFKDYAIDAFKVNAVDYILKPIDVEELEAAGERLMKRHELHKGNPETSKGYQASLRALSQDMLGRNLRLALHHQSGIKLVKPEEILYLSAEGNCSQLHFMDGGQYMDTRTLKSFEDRLDPAMFMRVHRSFIINMMELREFSREEGNHALMSSGIKVPVSRNIAPYLVERMRKL